MPDAIDSPAAKFDRTISRRSFLGTAAALGLVAGAGPVLFVEAAPSGQAGVRASHQDDATPVPGGSLVVGLSSEPDTLDIHVSPWAITYQVGLSLFDTLVYQDPADSSFKPGVATSWEVSPDGKEFTFTLRTDIKFHDGTALDADAVKFSLDRIADPATKSGWAATLLGPYSGSTVVDPQTIKVSFTEANAALFDGLSQAITGIVSPAAVAQYGADFGTNPVGSGPYVFKEWVPKDHLTVTRNPDYNWASPVFQHQGPAYFDEITFKFIAESSTRTGTIESGETQIIQDVPASDLDFVTDEGTVVVTGFAPGLPGVLLFNTTKAPTDDPAVRKALVQATDAKTIVETVFFGKQPVGTGALSAVSWAYNPDVASLYAFDPEGAAKTLDDAGYTLNGDYREKDGQRLSLDMFFSADWDGGTYAELWQSQLKDAGIELTIQQLDPSARITTATNGGTNVVANGWISSDPNILEHLFHSKNIGAYNWVFYKDDQLDALLDQGRQEIDTAKRKAIYGDVQKIIAEASLLAPLDDIVANFGHQPTVQGLRVDARGFYLWLYDGWIQQ